jgi:hypothetical protein
MIVDIGRKNAAPGTMTKDTGESRLSVEDHIPSRW